MVTGGTPRHVYAVTAQRDGRYWLLRVDELPGVFSQVRRLNQAEGMAADAIAAFLDVPPDVFEVRVEVRLPADIRRDVASVLDLRDEIERIEREYNERVRDLATRLVSREGMTVREAGRILGLSYQRVSQLVATASPLPEARGTEAEDSARTVRTFDHVKGLLVELQR